MARMTHTVEVETFGRACKFALTIPHLATVSQLKEEVRQTLGLRPASLAVFALSLGKTGQPTCVLEDPDPVPTGASMCLHRWTLDSERELKLARTDDAALHLLYSEARHRIDRGLLARTPEQEAELEELSDPAFPTERQFFELAQKLTGYSSFLAAGCKLERPLESYDVKMSSGATVECTMDSDKLSLRNEEDGSRLSWNWILVKRWNATSSHAIKFELCNRKNNAPVLEWISMATPQAYFLAQTARMICSVVKAQQQAALHPVPLGFNPLLPGRPYDPLVEYVNKELFGTLNFSSIGSSQK